MVNNRVYVGFGEGEENTFGFVYCLDAATGNVIWLFCTNQFEIEKDIDNSPNVIPPASWVLGGNPPPPFTKALDDPRFRGASPWSSPAFCAALNRIYIGTGNSHDPKAPLPDDPLPDPKYASGRKRGLDDPAALAGFLRGTARNLVVAERRKMVRRRTDLDDEELERAVHPGASQLSAVLLDEEAETVRRLIQDLPTERDRQLLLRYYVAEEDKESLCADLGLDSLHFNRVLFRARQRFKELLERARGEPVKVALP